MRSLPRLMHFKETPIISDIEDSRKANLEWSVLSNSKPRQRYLRGQVQAAKR
jgi:hypothetical protein